MADQADQIQLYVRAGAGPLLPLPSQGKPACLPVRVLHTTLLPTWTWWLYRLVHGERGPFAPACAAGCRMPAYQLKNLFSSSSSLPSHIVYQPTFPDMSDYKIHLLHRRLLLPALLYTCTAWLQVPRHQDATRGLHMFLLPLISTTRKIQIHQPSPASLGQHTGLA